METILFVFLLVWIATVAGFLLWMRTLTGRMQAMSSHLKDVYHRMSFMETKLDDQTKRIVNKVQSAFTDTLNYMDSKDILPSYAALSQEELCEEAMDLIEQEGICTPLLLEGHFRISHERALEIIMQLEEEGLIEPAQEPNLWLVIDDEDEVVAVAAETEEAVV